MKLLGLDPGKTTGWALVSLEGRDLKPIDFGHDKEPSMVDQTSHIKDADLVIIESFLVDPRYAKAGAFNYDDMIAPQVIGSLKTLCKMLDTPYVLQPASVKPVGYGFLGKTYVKGKKNMHKWDALAHICYYAVRNLDALPVKVSSSLT